MHVSDDLQSSPTSLGHKVLKNPVIKPCYFSRPHISFATALVFKRESRSSGERHQVFVLLHGERGLKSR